MTEYKKLIQEEIDEWKKIEKAIFKKGIPWWVDLRRAKISGKNLFWRDDPKKEALVRGEEKRRLIHLASIKKWKILDLGCGSGWLCLELARRGMNVLGVDVSPDRLKIARKFLRENPYKKGFGRVVYKRGDLNTIKFPKEEFDILVAWDTLHHFPNLEEVLVKVMFSLKPKGRLIIYDHLGNRYLKIASRITNFLSDKKEKIMPYEDVLGARMIEIIKRHFNVKIFFTRLAFPTSALLFLFFKYDIFLPLLPGLIKIDKLLCNLKLFQGEYFFLYAEKK